MIVQIAFTDPDTFPVYVNDAGLTDAPEDAVDIEAVVTLSVATRDLIKAGALELAAAFNGGLAVLEGDLTCGAWLQRVLGPEPSPLPPLPPPPSPPPPGEGVLQPESPEL